VVTVKVRSQVEIYRIAGLQQRKCIRGDKIEYMRKFVGESMESF
jgi:hypothetical protein